MSVTETQIRSLLREAAEAGDLMQVAQCRRALDGATAARDECERVILAALGQDDSREGVALYHLATGSASLARAAQLAGVSRDEMARIARARGIEPRTDEAMRDEEVAP